MSDMGNVMLWRDRLVFLIVDMNGIYFSFFKIIYLFLFFFFGSLLTLL